VQGAHWYDWRVFELRAFEERFDFVVVFLGLLFFDKVYFVLYYDEVFDAHYF